MAVSSGAEAEPTVAIQPRPKWPLVVLVLLLSAGILYSLVRISTSAMVAVSQNHQTQTNQTITTNMLSLQEWADFAALISAGCDLLTLGKESFTQYLDHRKAAPDALQRGAQLKAAFSTYSDDEIEAIKNRYKGCVDRFIAEGSGPARATCLCSVLNDVKAGNGGTFPLPEWEQVYEQLGCGTNK